MPDEVTVGGLKLRNLQPVGGGVQAEVFSAEMQGGGDRVVLKVSRLNNDYARGTFARECATLRSLADAEVPQVVRCLGEGEVATAEGLRQGMVLSPFLPGARDASVKSGRLPALSTLGAERARAADLVRTAARVLEAGVAGVDVQILEQAGTGRLLWIDFTEAALLKPGTATAASSGAVSPPVMICPEYEKRYVNAGAAVIGYASEVFLLVPPSARPLAAEALAAELCKLGSSPTRGPGARFQSVWARLPWWGIDAPSGMQELRRCTEQATAASSLGVEALRRA